MSYDLQAFAAPPHLTCFSYLSRVPLLLGMLHQPRRRCFSSSPSVGTTPVHVRPAAEAAHRPLRNQPRLALVGNPHGHRGGGVVGGVWRREGQHRQRGRERRPTSCSAARCCIYFLRRVHQVCAQRAFLLSPLPPSHMRPNTCRSARNQWAKDNNQMCFARYAFEVIPQ